MRPSLGAITDAVWFLAIQNELVTPSSEQGETASNRGGIREPSLFGDHPCKVLPLALHLGFCHKKARRGGGPGDGAFQYNELGRHMQR